MDDMGLITHSMFVERAVKWLRATPHRDWGYRCRVVLGEYHCYIDEIPDAIGFCHMESVVVECKINRADFLSDQKKSHRKKVVSLGNYRYYLTLPHVACVEEIPEGWGLLYAHSKKIVMMKPAPLHSELEIKKAEWSMMYSIIRRLELRGYLKEIQKLSKEMETLKEMEKGA